MPRKTVIKGYKCLLCDHLTEDETEMALHLGDDHSSWDLAEYAVECCSKPVKVRRRR